MKGLEGFRTEPKYHQPFAPEDGTICARLRRVFRGPPKPAPKPQYRDEKKYRHVPTHSASSFIKTTTTPVMVAALVEQNSKSPLEIRVVATPDPVSREHTPPPQSLI